MKVIKNIIAFISVFLMVLSGLLAQTPKWFVPFPNPGEVNYYYEISDPANIKFRMFERPPKWYADDVVTPCMIENKTRELNDGEYLWQLGEEHVHLNKSGSVYTLEEAEIKDPFLGRNCVMHFPQNNVVINDMSSMPSYSVLVTDIEIEYDVAELPEDLFHVLSTSEVRKLKVFSEATIVFEREGNSRFHSPYDIHSCLNLRVKETFVPKSFSITDTGVWEALDTGTSSQLLDYFKQTERSRLMFYDNALKRTVGSISLDNEDDKLYTGGHFIHGEKSPKLSQCNFQDGSIYVFPNPSFGAFNIRFYGYPEGTYKLNIHNIIGKIIYTYELDVLDGHNVPVSIPNISKGTYIYSIVNARGEKLQTKRLLIMGL